MSGSNRPKIKSSSWKKHISVKRTAIYTLALVILGVIAVLAGLAWLIATEEGLAWLTEKAQEFAPGKLEIEQVQGRLLDTFQIENFSYQYKELTVNFKNFQFTWQPQALADSTVHIKQFHLNQFNLHLPKAAESKPSDEPLTFPDFRLPVRVILEGVQIRDVAVQVAEEPPLVIDSIDLVTTTQEKISLQYVTVKSPQFQVTATGDLAYQAPYPLNLNLTWSAHLPNYPDARGQGQLTGDSQHLVFTHQLAEPFSVQTKLTVDEVLKNLRWRADLKWSELQWPLETPLVKSQNAEAHAQGTLRDYQFTLKTALAGQQIPAGRWQIKAQGDLHTLNVTALQANLLEGVVKATGHIQWHPQLQAQLKLDAEGLSAKPYWADWPAGLKLATQVEVSLKNQLIKVNRWHVRIPQTQAQVSGQGEATLAKLPQVKASVAWQKLRWPLTAAQPQVESTHGSLDLQGVLSAYQAKLTTDLTGARFSPLRLVSTLRGNLSQLTVENLHAQLLGGTVEINGQVGWEKPLSATFALRTQQVSPKEFWSKWPENLTLNTQIQGQWRDQTLQLSLCEVSFPQIATQFSLQGSGLLAEGMPSLNTTLTWRALQWPPTGNSPLVSSTQGQLKIEGTPDAYQFSLDTHLSGQTIPPGQWQATGQGNRQSIQLSELKGKLLQGDVNLAGQIRWQPQIEWQLSLIGHDINPGQQWPEWPGQLALNLQSQGELRSTGVYSQVTVEEIKGKLRNYPLELKTKLTLDKEQLSIQTLQVQSARTQLDLTGQVSPSEIAVDWTLAASDLTTVLPQLQGQLDGQGRLQGALTQPHISAHLQGDALGFNETKVSKLQADIDIDIAKNQVFSINASAKDFKHGASQVAQWQLKTQGQLAQHTLTTKIELPKNHTVELALAGGFDLLQTRWQGQLNQLSLSTAQFGAWQLREPTNLDVSPQQVQLTSLCLKSKNKDVTQLCIQLQWRAKAEGLVKMDLTDLSLAVLTQTLLPTDFALTGTVGAHTSVTLHADGNLRGQLNVDVSKGQLQGKLAKDLNTLPYQGGTLQVHITESGLTADVHFGLLEHSKIQGNLTLPNFTRLPLADSQPLQSQIQATFADMSLLPILAPQVANPQGQVSAVISATGQLKQPQLKGQIQMQKVALELPNLGLDLRDFKVSIEHNKPGLIDLNAHVRSGQGVLQLTGQTKFNSTTAWETALTIKGNQVEVINLPAVWVLASPAIDLQIAPKKVHAQGTIVIPEALIAPQGGAVGAVSVSKDVVIVNPKESVAEKSNAGNWLITSKVRVVLGDKVSFKMKGLNSRLQGALVASNQPNKEPTGHGELRVVEGSYKAYGQNLQIEQSRIVFTGGPLANPGLDVRAVRRIKQEDEEPIVAGLRIQGTAQAPQISLFSQPAFDETNTLSYILLGKPAAQMTEGEGQTLISAVSALSLDQGDDVTKSIANRFGLDEATISSEGGIEESALVLGKYLSPRLYISYGVGLFENINVFRIRYNLTKHLTLETETGTQSGADLHYTIEW